MTQTIVTDTCATTAAGWADVVAELTASCIRRAGDSSLWLREGAVGVLEGPAPVLWAHGEVNVDETITALRSATALHEVYVGSSDSELVDALKAEGWVADGIVAQLTQAGAPMHTESPLSVVALQPGDLADVRQLLRESGVEEEILEASYGDDFFVVAAPVWLFGARDDEGRLVGVVGVRRQGRSAMGFGLTVAPAYRRTGLSAALVAAGMAQATDAGAEFVHAQANPACAGRLVACGFSVVGAWTRLVRA